MRKLSSLTFIILFFCTGIIHSQSNTIGSGISLVFDGNSNNFVDLDDTYNSLTFPYTIEVWVKLNSYVSPTSFVFTTDNNSTAYSGTGVHIRPDGTISFAFGSNTGASVGNRGGVISSAQVPLNQWTHIACVAFDPAEMRIYVNGVPSIVSFDGSATYIATNSSHGSIGRRVDPYGVYTFDGEMDEVRLWDIARSQAEIRDYMCRKIDASISGLIGYWKADESYSGTNVADSAIPAENGTIQGTINKVTSGAPIGDESTYGYASSWNGVTVSETDISGDQFTAGNITASPYGVHVYLVKSLPYDVAGLELTPSFYFGVFCAPSGNTPQYDATYHYDFGNNTINSGNELTADLYKRDDGTVVTWINASGTLNAGANTILNNNETSRSEYILNVEQSEINFSASDNIICEKFCTNFIDQSVNNPTSWQWLFPGGSPSTSIDQYPANICYTTPGIYDVTLITTGTFGIDTLTLTNYMTVYATPSFPVITQTGYTLNSSAATSYQWQLNSVDIPGATNQSYDVMQSGYYTVRITDSHGCTNSISLYVLISGLNELLKDNSISIFSNPNDGTFELGISTPSLGEGFMLRIVNSLGEEVYSSQQKAASVAGWNGQIIMPGKNSGLYFVEIKSDQFFGREKILVIR